MKKCKLLLFDLDGTLLQSDKTISTRTLSALKKCRGNDILIGVSTSRSEQNSLVFLNELMPDILISSGGALVKYKTEYIYRAEFSEEETNVMIDMARNICGNDCEITIDTIDAHYWNYKIDPKKLDKSWGDSIYTDFSDFNECSLKMCVEIFNQDKADKLTRSLSDCDCIRFSDGFWYKFTKKNVTKENAIMKITEVCGFSTDSKKSFMVWQLVNGEEMMICQLQEMVKHGAVSSIMRTGRVYAIKRTKEALRQKQKQRSGSGTSGNSREKIWILTLRILLKSISLMWRTGLEKAQSRIKDMCLI